MFDDPEDLEEEELRTTEEEEEDPEEPERAFFPSPSESEPLPLEASVSLSASESESDPLPEPLEEDPLAEERLRERAGGTAVAEGARLRLMGVGAALVFGLGGIVGS